jgi:hypothetical protein
MKPLAGVRLPPGKPSETQVGFDQRALTLLGGRRPIAASPHSGEVAGTLARTSADWRLRHDGRRASIQVSRKSKMETRVCRFPADELTGASISVGAPAF